jgi:hypothetical protein
VRPALLASWRVLRNSKIERERECISIVICLMYIMKKEKGGKIRKGTEMT